MITPVELKRIRQMMGWTQTEAAAKAGVAANTWSRWEEGLVKPHPLREPVLQRMLRQAERRQAARDARAQPLESDTAAVLR